MSNFIKKSNTESKTLTGENFDSGRMVVAPRPHAEVALKGGFRDCPEVETSHYLEGTESNSMVGDKNKKNTPLKKGDILKKTVKTLAAAMALLFIVIVVLLNVFFPFKYSRAVLQYSEEFEVDRRLVYAVIWTESKFDPSAVSRAGAMGLMQLLPTTAEWCAQQLGIEFDSEKLLQPDYNLRLGVFYLGYLVHKYGEADAITAYNAGEGNLLSWQGEVRFKETRQYIRRVNFAKRVYGFKSK